MEEFVCADGRMSVNGICSVFNQNDGDPKGGGRFDNLDLDDFKTFDKEVYSIDMSAPGEKVTASFKPEKVKGYKNLNTGNYQTFQGKNVNHAGIPVVPLAAKVLGLDNLSQQKKKGLDLDYQLGSTKGTFTDFFNKDKTKDFSKDVKSNFQWDFDKVGNKIQNFGTTIKGNINAYDKYVEENLGIPRDISHGLRAASIGMGVVKYGALGALAPFAIPLVVGSALNSQKRKEEYKIDQNQMRDEVATIQSRVDNQYQNQLTNDGKDFSVSGDNVSSNKKGADNRASQERGYQLHG